MTSIEWLIEQLFKQGYFDGNKPLTFTNLDHLQQQAKEMHKQEIIDAYCAGEDNIDNDGCTIGRNGKETYYNETFVSKGSGNTLKDYHIVDTNEMIDTYKVWKCCGMEECICKDDDALTDDEWIIKQKHQQITNTAIEFAKWLASNWIPLHVSKEYLWEYDELDLSKIPQDYRGYKTEKQLFDIFQSLKSKQ